MQTLQTDKNKLSAYIADLQSGSRPRGGVRGIASGIPSIGGEHLNNLGGFDFSSIKYVPENFANSMSKGIINTDDILIVKDGATTGKVSFVDTSFPYSKAVVNEHVFIIKNNGKMLPKLLFWYLWSNQGQREILNNFQGSAQGGINRSFIDGVDVPNIPTEKQKKLLNLLEKIIPQTWTDKGKLDNAKRKVEQFKKAILSAAITGKLTEDWRNRNPNVTSASVLLNSARNKNRGVALHEGKWDQDKKIKGWISCQIKHIFSVQTGSTPYRKSLDYYDGGTIPWVKTGEVQNCDIFKTEEKITMLAVKETNVKLFPINTILIAMYGEGKTRGQVGRLKIEAGTNQACAALVNPNLPSFFNEYVFFYCLSQYTSLRQQSVGGNQPNLNLTKIKEWQILIPSEKEMKEIVSQVKKYFDIANQVEKQIEKAEARVSKLTQAILAKTFRNENYA